MNTWSQIPKNPPWIFFPNTKVLQVSPDVIAFTEAQLADILVLALSDDQLCQPLPEIDPTEFEKLYCWFLS